MHDNVARFRFYAELNDFIPAGRRQKEFTYLFSGHPSVKDAVEAIGVPHPEVDLILVNDASVGFDYHLQSGDRVAVYPVFESMDISPVIHLRPVPLRKPAFLVAGHLGKLARLLRMLGFDSLCREDLDDAQLIRTALDERRIILTRDRGLLKTGAVTHGYCIRADDPREQVREVLVRFDLFSQVKPFHRCMVCNGVIADVEKEAIADELPEKTKLYYNEFHRCHDCGRIYWKGSHYHKMQDTIHQLAHADHAE
ncbi:MAG: Mut7-C RNAse domain-containing protein [Candidatus Krumholzibacteria bacterium]